MDKHKSEKINKVLNESDGDLNLHEIKAKTGAGNGYKHKSESVKADTVTDTFENTTKSEKIQEAVESTEGKVNLHKIKAQTGAGNGYSNTESTENNFTNDVFVNTSKFDKIHKVVSNIEGKANLHKIKAQTGAGNGYADKEASSFPTNAPKIDYSNTADIHSHRSHKIHAVFHEHDRKLNLHEIKAKTGAGSGYKHQ